MGTQQVEASTSRDAPGKFGRKKLTWHHGNTKAAKDGAFLLPPLPSLNQWLQRAALIPEIKPPV